MNVAFVAQPLDTVRPPAPNSVGLWIYEVARRLARRHRVTVYGRGHGPAAEQLVDEGVRYVLLPLAWDARLERFASWLPSSASSRLPAFARARRYAAYAWRIAVRARAEGVELLHVMNFSQLVGPLRALNPRAALVLDMQCEWLSQLDAASMAARLARVDAVVGCSEHVTSRARARFPRAAATFGTLYPGTDAAPPPCPSAAERNGSEVLFVGRVSPEKGVHVLVEAMPRIVAEHPGVRFRILGGHRPLAREYLVDLSDEPLVRSLARFYEGGGGPYVERLRRRIAELGLSAEVELAGAVGHAEVTAAYARAVAVVNPSLSESFGRSVIEAMAAGVPVVAARTGGMLETVKDGENGLLVAAGDADALAAAVVRVLDDAALRERLRKGAAASVGRFGWDRIAEDVDRFHREVAA